MSEHEVPRSRRRGSETTNAVPETSVMADAVHAKTSPPMGAGSGKELFTSWTPADPQGTWDLAESGAASNTNGAPGHAPRSALQLMLGSLIPGAGLMMKAFGSGHQAEDTPANNQALFERPTHRGKASFGRHQRVPPPGAEQDPSVVPMLSRRNQQRLDDFRASMAVLDTLPDLVVEQAKDMATWLAAVGIPILLATRGLALTALRAALQTNMGAALGYAIPAGAASIHYSTWFNAAWDADGDQALIDDVAKPAFAGLVTALAAWRAQFGFTRGANGAGATGAKATANVEAPARLRDPAGAAAASGTAAASETVLVWNPATNQWEVPQLALPGPTGGLPAIPSGQGPSPLVPSAPAAGRIPALTGGTFLPDEYHDPNELIAHLEAKGYSDVDGTIAQSESRFYEVIQKARPVDQPYLFRLRQLLGEQSRAPAIRTSKTADRPLRPDAKVLVIANRVPGPGAGGGLVTGVKAALAGQDAVWAGSGDPVADTAHGAEHVDDSEPGLVRVKYDIAEPLNDGFYKRYSNQGIWAAQHNAEKRINCSEDDYRDYNQVNRFFGGKPSELVNAKAPVWWHDYHFFEAASYMEEREGPSGWFSHIPQAEYEIFKRIPGWENLIKGVLSNNLVGFHIWDYAKNFIDLALRVGANRVGDSALEFNNRLVQVGAYPIGIDPKIFAYSPDRKAPAELKGLPRFGQDGFKVMGSVERLDWTKGVPERLRAFQYLLRNQKGEYRDWRGKVSMVQIAVGSRAGVEGYDELAKEVQALVDEINGEFTQRDASGKITYRPVQYLVKEKGYAQSELGAFYDNFDVVAVTPQDGDGMNLVAKEAEASQNPDDPAVLLLGRTGASRQLQTAVHTDPRDVKRLADDMEYALTMPRDERIARHKPNFRNVVEQDAVWWGESFMSDLEETKKTRRPR